MSEQRNHRIIRPSMLSSYTDCNLRALVQSYWWLFKQYGYVVPFMQRGAAQVVGTAFASGVKQMLRNKVATGSIGNPDDSADAAVASFEQEISKGWEIDDTTPSRAAGVDQVSTMTRVYAGYVGYKLDPEQVEQKFTCKLTAISPGWEGSGTIDNRSKQGVLNDDKTGKGVMQYLPQVGMYERLSNANGLPVEQITITQLQRHKITQSPNEPVIYQIDVDLARKMAVKVVRRAIADVDQFVASDGDSSHIATNPNSWVCSQKYCPCYNWCPAVRGITVIKT